MQVAVGLISREEEGVSTKYLDDVHEEDTEAADVSRVELVQETHQALFSVRGCSENRHVVYSTHRYIVHQHMWLYTSYILACHNEHVH